MDDNMQGKSVSVSFSGHVAFCWHCGWISVSGRPSRQVKEKKTTPPLLILKIMSLTMHSLMTAEPIFLFYFCFPLFSLACSATVVKTYSSCQQYLWLLLALDKPFHNRTMHSFCLPFLMRSVRAACFPWHSSSVRQFIPFSWLFGIVLIFSCMRFPLPLHLVRIWKLDLHVKCT